MKRAFPHLVLESDALEFNQPFNHSKKPPQKTPCSTQVSFNHQTVSLGAGQMVKAGSAAWSGRSSEEKNPENTPNQLDKMDKIGRVIFARDLEPILTRLEPTPTGPRLVLESDTFAAILPASPHILKLLARKLQATVTA